MEDGARGPEDKISTSYSLEISSNPGVPKFAAIQV